MKSTMRAATSRQCCLFVLLLSLLPSAGPAQDASVKPGINDNFKDPNLKVEEWAGRFETESREVYHLRERIVKAAGVKPDWTVADVGAGTGLFTMLFAEAVGPGGKVLAVDIAAPFLAKIRERAKAAGRPNVETVLGTDKDAKLPINAVDLVFICDTYHHFEFPKDTLASIHRALKPGGLVALVDFQRIPGKSSDWVLSHVRAGKDTFVEEFAKAGFEVVDEADFLEENYLVRLKKRDR
jgi:ubiquinone/menaquinone biosynthesis C-methylase UbiE